MTSTYSNLKVQLMGTGDNATTWGNVTNTNLGTTLEQAIAGSVDVTFASADVTLTLTDTNSSQSARNLRLNLTGTTGGARSLILGSGCQINKVYIVNNGCADTITVKNTTGAGIAVPTGKTMWVFNNGTAVVDVTTYLTTLSLGTPLAAASGGTGTTTGITALNASSITSGTLNILYGGTGVTTGLTALNASSVTSGTLLPAQGGTGINTYAVGDIVYASGATTLSKLADVATGNVLISGGVTTAPSYGKVGLTTHVSGILPVANGGTGTGTGFGTMSSQNANAVAITGGTIAGTSIDNSPIGATTRNSGAFTTLNASSTTTLSADAVFGAFYTPTTVYSIGYRGIPQIGGAAKTASYQLLIGDAGGHVYLTGSTASQTITVPASSTAFPIGTTISIVNAASVNWSVAITTDTMTLAGGTSTGIRTLAVGAVATLIKVDTTKWYISGAGVS